MKIAVRFTSKLDPATRKKLFGVTGLDGAHWHHPLLGPISEARALAIGLVRPAADKEPKR